MPQLSDARQLSNARHERFARAIADGATPDEALRRAGYRPGSGIAARLARRVDVMRRLVELSGAEPGAAEATAGMRDVAPPPGMPAGAARPADMDPRDTPPPDIAAPATPPPDPDLGPALAGVPLADNARRGAGEEERGTPPPDTPPPDMQAPASRPPDPDPNPDLPSADPPAPDAPPGGVPTRQWVLARLVDNVERALQLAGPADGAEPGARGKYDGSVANRALELLGKELGMFAERPDNQRTAHDISDQPLSPEEWARRHGVTGA